MPERFSAVIADPSAYRLQIVYTRIDRDKKGRPRFTEHRFPAGDPGYFYPASTVKLPVAALALQRLRELSLPGLDLNSTFESMPVVPGMDPLLNDPSAADGRPTVAHYIRKVLLVSDNDAFNRLYGFLGQDYVNRSLRAMGYDSARILHRLSISLPEAKNRIGDAVSFYDSAGALLYRQAPDSARMVIPSHPERVGKGYFRGDSLVNEPLDFSRKNQLPLEDLHAIVKSLIFPEAVPARRRFGLLPEDYAFLRRYMCMMPFESASPRYDTATYYDTYVKFLYYGSEKGSARPGLHIFNKVGDAYGFLTDAAYFAEPATGVEFFLSATIYCNSDGILNDDRYDYDQLGFPFLKELGLIFYEYERQRPKKRLPDLGSFAYPLPAPLSNALKE